VKGWILVSLLKENKAFFEEQPEQPAQPLWAESDAWRRRIQVCKTCHMRNRTKATFSAIPPATDNVYPSLFEEFKARRQAGLRRNSKEHMVLQYHSDGSMFRRQWLSHVIEKVTKRNNQVIMSYPMGLDIQQ
jgi:hypothetical protein